MGIKQGTRKMKAEETKKKIFESAVAMFKERGFENLKPSLFVLDFIYYEKDCPVVKGLGE